MTKNEKAILLKAAELVGEEDDYSCNAIKRATVGERADWTIALGPGSFESCTLADKYAEFYAGNLRDLHVSWLHIFLLTQPNTNCQDLRILMLLMFREAGADCGF